MSKFSLCNQNFRAEKKHSRAGSDAKKAVNVSARIARLSRKGGTNQEEHPERLFAVFFFFFWPDRGKKRWKEKDGYDPIPSVDRGGKSSGGWMDDSWVSIPAWMRRKERRSGWMDEGKKEGKQREKRSWMEGARSIMRGRQ